MALYEITFLTKEETDPGVRHLLEQAGGAITEESTLASRRLTYPIKKQIQAYFTTYVFDAEPSGVAELNQKLRQQNDILRYLIVTKPTLKADKEVSKTVREAIEAAEKLEDTLPEAKLETVPAAPPTVSVDEAIDAAVAEDVETTTPARTEEKLTKRRATKKTEKAAAKPAADAAEATEEDRLKALEDKLGEILGQ